MASVPEIWGMLLFFCSPFLQKERKPLKLYCYGCIDLILRYLFSLDKHCKSPMQNPESGTESVTLGEINFCEDNTIFMWSVCCSTLGWIDFRFFPNFDLPYASCASQRS